MDELLEKLKQGKYAAFMEFAYTLKYLELVSVREAVHLTGGVFHIQDEP
jgi:hypothetical protein